MFVHLTHLFLVAVNEKEKLSAEHTVFCGPSIVYFVFVVVLNSIELINKINKITKNCVEKSRRNIRKMISSSALPPLPENEKTYAGIPEAVFVVSWFTHIRIINKVT